MFTKDQGQELLDNTDYELTTINGKKGCKFISKTDSSKYIFIPAGGLYYPSSESIGNSGYYWTTTQYVYDPVSQAYDLRYGTRDVFISAGLSKYRGCPIRPVRQL